MKKALIVAAGLAVVLAFAGCAKKEVAAPVEEKKPVVLRVGHTLTDDSHYGVGLAKLAELVKAKSGGSMEVQVFGNSKLGNERDLIEGVSLGTIEMCLTSTGPLPSFSKSFMVFDLPFIVQDRLKFYPILDGPTGQGMLDSLSVKAIKGIVFFENGFRNITNSRKPITSPKDMAGMKIRVMENPVHLETFKVLGANPSPMPFGELFTALQQKTMDGQENPLLIIKTSKFYEVQKNLALTGHFYSPAVLMINEKLYKGLAADQQKALMDAASEARDFERNFIIESEKKIVDELKAAGMDVTSPDKAVFQKATESVYKKFEAEIGKELIDKIRG
jgi:tripartite ATP-independent transporter DctP family solute receptor